MGMQQGALIVLMASLPLVVEAALRGRVSTEVELGTRGGLSKASWRSNPRFKGVIYGLRLSSAQGQQRAVTFWNGLGEMLGFVRVPTIAEAVPFRENLTSAYPKRLEDEGLTFCVVCSKKTQLHRCAMCCGPLHLTCVAKKQSGESDIICGPCCALRDEPAVSHMIGEAAYTAWKSGSSIPRTRTGTIPGLV